MNVSKDEEVLKQMIVTHQMEWNEEKEIGGSSHDVCIAYEATPRAETVAMQWKPSKHCQ